MKVALIGATGFVGRQALGDAFPKIAPSQEMARHHHADGEIKADRGHRGALSARSH